MLMKASSQSLTEQLSARFAQRIRARGGGFPAVKALGLLVDGQAQVSMNLVDYIQTPIYVVFDAIKRLAESYGVNVVRSELIGLAPQAAILETVAHYLKLPDLHDGQTIEGALMRAQLG